MKIKKIIAGVAAAVMACTTMAAMSVSAINAGGTSIVLHANRSGR